jgi:hypothetical protein
MSKLKSLCSNNVISKTIEIGITTIANFVKLHKEKPKKEVTQFLSHSSL